MSSLGDKDWEEVIRYIDLIELAPRLIERGLLEFEDVPNDTLECRRCFVSLVRQGGPDSLSNFSSCFEAEDNHLGHDYIACLLKGKMFASEATIRRSSEYQCEIKCNMTKVVEMLNIKSLIPHLLTCRLLSPDEATSLDKSSMENTLKLFQTLKRKGPTAFGLFVSCLRDASEHPGHQELFSLLFKGQRMSPLSPKTRKPAELTMEDPLIGPEYLERRCQFEKLYHSGQWCEVHKLAQQCMESKVHETQAVGHLEIALSYIFRLDKIQVVHHIQKAEDICKNIQNNNKAFLSGRCKYLLSLLYLYLDEVSKAEEYIKDARSTLCFVEVGEDKSFCMYCDAKISATLLKDDSSEYDFIEVTRKFESALEYSLRSKNLDILVMYSLLRLGSLYLGTTATRIHIAVDEDRIQKSMDCLQELKTSYYDKMDERCKSLHHINESDLHRCRGLTSKALDSAKQAEKFAVQCDCPVEIEAVQIRIAALTAACA